MIRALAYLQVNTWKNHLLVRLRRLRQPKYLFGAIVGAAYFYFYFFRHLFSARSYDTGQFFDSEQLAGFQMLGAAVLFVVMLLAWVLPRKRAALNFSEAEVAFLFTAPVRRTTLIHYKLITSQVTLLLTSFFLTFISGRFASAPYAWMPLIGYWLIFATMGLHFLAASFMRTMLLDRGLSPKRWRITAVAAVFALIVAIFLSARSAVTTFNPAAFEDIRNVGTELSAVFSSGLIPYLLWPFKMLLQPLFARDLLSFTVAVIPVLCVYALQYMWVLRMNVAFEEASAEHSRKRAELVTAARKGEWKLTASKPRRAWFKLSPMGTPLIAIFWKNLISIGSAFQRQTFIGLLIAVVVSMIIFAKAARAGGASLVGFMALMFLVWSVLLGPALLRQDFRQDLAVAELLKLLPLRGWQIAVGQLLTPAVVLTLVQWSLLAMAAFFFDVKQWSQVHYADRLLLLGSLATLLPLITFVTLTIPNFAVVLFPAWFQHGRDAPQGIEATGQRLILMLGQILGLTLLIAPVAVVGGISGAVGHYFGGLGLAIVAATTMAVLLLCFEAGLMIWWLGKAFEKLDLAKETST